MVTRVHQTAARDVRMTPGAWRDSVSVGRDIQGSTAEKVKITADNQV